MERRRDDIEPRMGFVKFILCLVVGLMAVGISAMLVSRLFRYGWGLGF
jgi:hypothetical protein